MDGIQDIGQRIVAAARLAVAVHLYESVARHTEPFVDDFVDDNDGAVSRDARQILRRRQVVTGGAGESEFREETHTSSRLGDLVTDDEWDGLMGRDDDESSIDR